MGQGVPAFVTQAPLLPFLKMATTEATSLLDNMEVRDEWQDEDFPRWDPS